MNNLDKEEESFLSNIAALHVTYYHTQDKIMWFGQLASKMPLILKKLQKPFSSNNEMVSDYLLNLNDCVNHYYVYSGPFPLSYCTFML